MLSEETNDCFQKMRHKIISLHYNLMAVNRGLIIYTHAYCLLHFFSTSSKYYNSNMTGNYCLLSGSKEMKEKHPVLHTNFRSCLCEFILISNILKSL